MPRPAVSVDLVIAQLHALLDDERDPIANAANIAAFAYQSFADLNWVGFYFVRGDELVLGPFIGKPAVARIARGRGVCGRAWNDVRTLVVPDVRAIADHIACDTESNAEIVVPILRDGRVIGVIDVDSPVLDRFDSSDRETFEAIARLYADRSNALA